MEISWSDYKNFVNSRGVSVQFLETSDNYLLKAFDGPFSVTCLLPKNVNNLDTIDFETNYKTGANLKLEPASPASPFSAKVILHNGTQKKLYKRQHGQQFACSTGNNDILFTIPYPWVKITGIRLINAEALDTCSFYVLDSTTGTYTTIPNYVLNQFGANVNIAVGDHEEHCKYDADLYTGMQIKLVYNSQSAKTIGINYVLHEVKD